MTPDKLFDLFTLQFIFGKIELVVSTLIGVVKNSQRLSIIVLLIWVKV